MCNMYRGQGVTMTSAAANETAPFTTDQAAKIRATFESRPSLYMAIVEMDHAYGKSKFDSRCKLTGDRIMYGEAIRRVTIAFRDGRWFQGFIANRTLGLLETNNVDDLYFGTATIPGLASDWKADIAEFVQNAEANAELHMFSPGDHDSFESGKHYCFNGQKWVRSRFDGGLSTAQLLAGIKRRRHMVAYRMKTADQRW